MGSDVDLQLRSVIVVPVSRQEPEGGEPAASGAEQVVDPASDRQILIEVRRRAHRARAGAAGGAGDGRDQRREQNADGDE